MNITWDISNRKDIVT